MAREVERVVEVSERNTETSKGKGVELGLRSSWQPKKGSGVAERDRAARQGDCARDACWLVGWKRLQEKSGWVRERSEWRANGSVRRNVGHARDPTGGWVGRV